jgi:chromatin assembly factor 1 subunit B
MVSKTKSAESSHSLTSRYADGLIILWVPSDLPPSNFGEESAEEMGDKEYWRDKRAIKYVFTRRVTRAASYSFENRSSVTKQEIYDIAWSPDGKYIIAGSTDNLAQVFSVADGTLFLDT